MIVNFKRNLKNSMYNMNINLAALTITGLNKMEGLFFPSTRAAVHTLQVGSSALHSNLKIQIFLSSCSTIPRVPSST